MMFGNFENPDKRIYDEITEPVSQSHQINVMYVSAGATNAAVERMAYSAESGPLGKYGDPYGGEDHPGDRFAVPFAGNSGGGSGGYEVSDIDGHLHSYESAT